MTGKTKLWAILLAAAWIAVLPASAKMTAEDVYPDELDPLVGDYEGRWGPEEEVNPAIAAQVYPLGKDKYGVRIVTKLDMRCPPLVDTEVTAENGKIELDSDGINATCDGKTFNGARGSGKFTFTMNKVDRHSPTEGKAAPEGAIVLYDGTNLDAWDSTDGWEILRDGTLMVTPDGDYLVSKQPFTDVTLHVEFRTPLMARARGQQRGNSGVFVQGTYEVQVLDSYGLEGYYDECGALYKLSAPHVNAVYPPLTWQTYDIEYTAPQYDASGTLTANGRMTVYHNGVLIHNDQELLYRTDWKEVDRKKPAPKDPGPIKLQGHNNFVQFRNVWLVDNSK